MGFKNGLKEIGSGFATIGKGVAAVTTKVASPVTEWVDEKRSLHAANEAMKDEMVEHGKQLRDQQEEAELREKLHRQTVKAQARAARAQAKLDAEAQKLQPPAEIATKVS